MCDTVRSDLPAVVMATGGVVDITVTLPAELVGKASASTAKPEETLSHVIEFLSNLTLFLEVTKKHTKMRVQYS